MFSSSLLVNKRANKWLDKIQFQSQCCIEIIRTSPSKEQSVQCWNHTVAESVFMVTNQTNESVFNLPNVQNNSFVTHKSIIICTFICAVHCAFLNGPVTWCGDVHSGTLQSFALRFLPKIFDPQLLNALINLQRKICHGTHPTVILKAVVCNRYDCIHSKEWQCSTEPSLLDMNCLVYTRCSIIVNIIKQIKLKKIQSDMNKKQALTYNMHITN